MSSLSASFSPPAYPVPPLDSALRLEWAHLPPGLRAGIEREIGAQVLGAESIEAGFTPGMAAVLTCVDGSQHFVKAASKRAQRSFAASYSAELAVLRHLPVAAPAPALLWGEENDDWVVFSTRYVESDPVGRPWDPEVLRRTLTTLERSARDLTPAPARMKLNQFGDDTASWVSGWDGLEVPAFTERAAEGRALAVRARKLLRGETLCHTDIRADNVLLPTPDGAADGSADGVLFCDWNWPSRGPDWLDAYMLLATAWGDGVDVDAQIAQHEFLRAAPAEAVDSLLALMAGYFLRAGCGSVPPNSPHVRDHQYWTGTICWLWLAERRGW